MATIATPETNKVEKNKREKMLEERIAALEQLLSNRTTENAHEPENNSLQKETEAWLNETVDIKLFKDGEKYKDDVTVTVNGVTCRIKRGEFVKVKRKYALVLEQSEIQDRKTSDMMTRKAEEFTAESRKYEL